MQDAHRDDFFSQSSMSRARDARAADDVNADVNSTDNACSDADCCDAAELRSWGRCNYVIEGVVCVW